MLRGWTMLADPCSVASCKCPLMRSPDGKKYCVNCEEWVSEKKREAKKFNELLPPKIGRSKKENQMKKEIKQKEEKKENVEQKIEIINESKDIIITDRTNSNESVIQLLDNKLKILAQNLLSETDFSKSEQIIRLMDRIIVTIDNYKKINK